MDLHLCISVREFWYQGAQELQNLGFEGLVGF